MKTNKNKKIDVSKYRIAEIVTIRNKDMIVIIAILEFLFSWWRNIPYDSLDRYKSDNSIPLYNSLT